MAANLSPRHDSWRPALLSTTAAIEDLDVVGLLRERLQ
jgi:hypothetical protein